jgi:hypothetical protein
MTASLSRGEYEHKLMGSSLFKSGYSYRNAYCSPMDCLGPCAGLIRHAVAVLATTLAKAAPIP